MVSSQITEMVERFLAGEDLDSLAKRFGRKRGQVADSIASRIAWHGGTFHSSLERHPAHEELWRFFGQPGIGNVKALKLYRAYKGLV